MLRAFTIGLTGQFSLCILGRPYNEPKLEPDVYALIWNSGEIALLFFSINNLLVTLSFS